MPVFFIKPEAAQIVNKCLFYSNPAPYPTLLSYLYILITIGSGAISSRPIIKLFCVLLLVSSLISRILYSYLQPKISPGGEILNYFLFFFGFLIFFFVSVVSFGHRK